MKSVNKLCQEVGNDEYMIVCNFGSRRMNGFEVIEREEGRDGGGGGGLRCLSRSQETKKSRVWTGLLANRLQQKRNKMCFDLKYQL